MEPVAGKSGWDRELEETTNLKAMVGIELLFIRTLLKFLGRSGTISFSHM